MRKNSNGSFVKLTIPTLMMSIYFGFPDCHYRLNNGSESGYIVVLSYSRFKFCKILTNLEIRWLERCKILVCVGCSPWLWLVLIHLVDRWRLSRPEVTYCDTLGFLAYTNSLHIQGVPWCVILQGVP